MTRPSTVAALAVLVCLPALLSFASGNLSVLALGVRYLGAVVVVAVAAHVLERLLGLYSKQPEEGPSEEEHSDPGAP